MKIGMTKLSWVNLSHLRKLGLLLCFIAVVVIVFQHSRGFDILPEGEIRVHFIDVGQGESILVQSRQHSILIDAGLPAVGSNIVAYLERLGINSLDYVIVTHPHSDHIGGMPAVLDRFSINNFWMPNVIHETTAFERLLEALERNHIYITTVEAGARINAGIINMIVVSPHEGVIHTNLNDYSIVLYMSHGNISFLFTGDAEAPAEMQMIAGELPIKANVLNIGHHGSRTSTTEAFLDAVRPQVAVISLGANNQFGHPHRYVIERLIERDIKILRTDELGTIVIATDGENLFLYSN